MNIERGHLFDKNESYHYLYEFDSVYANRYSMFQRYTVNLVNGVEKPVKDYVTCQKRSIGCQHGCLHSCLAKNVKNKNNRLYILFSDLYEKYFAE
jgi:hypothetical protein